MSSREPPPATERPDTSSRTRGRSSPLPCFDSGSRSSPSASASAPSARQGPSPSSSGCG
jgi:hypothetical protein